MVNKFISRIGKGKIKGFTSFDLLAHIFAIGLFLLTMQVLFSSSGVCQTVGCRSRASIVLPLRF